MRRPRGSLLVTGRFRGRVGSKAEPDDLVMIGKHLLGLVCSGLRKLRLKALNAAKSIVAKDYRSHVILGFQNGWHLVPMRFHRMFARVVSGECKAHVAPKSVKQPSQVLDASENVLAGVVYIAHTQPNGSPRHQLHRSSGALWG